MFNVILTKKDGTELYVGSDGTLVPMYTEEKALKYEFDDYEDAENVKNEFVTIKFIQNYNEEKINKVKNIEVVQM